MRLRIISLLVLALGFFSNCEAIHFKDSTSALFLRIGAKTFNQMNTRSSNIGVGRTSYTLYPSYGYYVGLRHSNVLDDKLWTIITSLEIQYDWAEMNLFTGYNGQGNYQENRLNVELLSNTLSYGIKYNRTKLRPAFSLFLNHNINSRVNDADSVGYLSNLFDQETNTLAKNKLALGLKIEFLLPLHKKIGLAFTGSGTLVKNILRSNHNYIFGSDYFGIAFDYKISK